MSNSIPKISVVVTVYNVEKYIYRCIESVLLQSFEDFELIVVDDATPDKSMDIVNQFVAKDHRVKVVRNEVNSGLMWARKVGVENSDGQFVVYLDSDDTLPTDALKKLYKEIISSDADMVSGNIVYKKLDGSEEVWKSNLGYGNDTRGVYEALLRNQYRHNLCGHIFRKEVLTNPQLHYYKNFTKWEDYCLFYQLVDSCKKVEHIDEPVYYYFQTAGSSTQVRISDRSLETTVIAHREAYDILKSYDDLRGQMYRNFQYCFCRLLNDGYGKVCDYLKEYDLYSVINTKNIIKYNSFTKSLKLLIMKCSLPLNNKH